MWDLFALVPLLLVVGFGPGFFVVRYLRWSPLETLVASVGLSLSLLFLALFAAFWMDASHMALVVITTGAAGLSAATWPDARRLWRHRIVRRATFSLVGLAAWTLLVLSLIREYGGGDTCCDWLEHYQRTQHFLSRWPDDFLYINRYLFTARPPLMNAVAAYLLRWVGTEFAHFQIVFSVLNVLVLLACCLVSRVVSRTGRPADPRLLAIMLGANPMFFMNTTFAWTKVLTAFFILLGLALYTVGWKRQDRARVAGAFLALAAAVLTHYSAAVYALVIGGHYLWTQLTSRPSRWREIVPTTALALVLVAPWIGYVVATYGVADGIVRNPSFEGTSDQSLAEHATTRWLNVVDTFIPHAYDGYNDYPADATTWRRLSDQIFTIYQSTAIFSIGSVAGLMAIVLAYGALRRVTWLPERRFWYLLVPVVCILGVVVHGDRSDTGLAMISLQPITYLAVVFLAARVRALPAWCRRLWFASAILDVGAGIGLALWFEATHGEWARTPNWDLKDGAGILFLGDVVPPAIPLLLMAVMAIMAATFTARHVIVSRTR